jgi:hypothetical protein
MLSWNFQVSNRQGLILHHLANNILQMNLKWCLISAAHPRCRKQTARFAGNCQNLPQSGVSTRGKQPPQTTLEPRFSALRYLRPPSRLFFFYPNLPPPGRAARFLQHPRVKTRGMFSVQVLWKYYSISRPLMLRSSLRSPMAELDRPFV